MMRTGIVIGEQSGNIETQNENVEFGLRITGITIEKEMIKGAVAGSANVCASSCEVQTAPISA